MSNLSNDTEISPAGHNQTLGNDRAGGRRSRSLVSRFRHGRHTLNVPTNTSTDYYTPLPVQPSHSSHSPATRKRSATYALGASLDDPQQDEFTDGNKQTATQRNKVVMAGWLYKTTRPKTSKTRGHRQHRQFRLTAHSLEYDQFFQKVSEPPS